MSLHVHIGAEMWHTCAEGGSPLVSSLPSSPPWCLSSVLILDQWFSILNHLQTFVT